MKDETEKSELIQIQHQMLTQTPETAAAVTINNCYEELGSLIHFIDEIEPERNDDFEQNKFNISNLEIWVLCFFWVVEMRNHEENIEIGATHSFGLISTASDKLRKYEKILGEERVKKIYDHVYTGFDEFVRRVEWMKEEEKRHYDVGEPLHPEFDIDKERTLECMIDEN